MISASSRPGPGHGRPRWPGRRPRPGRTPRSRSRRPTACCRRPRAGSRPGPAPTAAAAGCAPSRRRRRRAPHVPPGTSSPRPTPALHPGARRVPAWCGLGCWISSSDPAPAPRVRRRCGAHRACCGPSGGNPGPSIAPLSSLVAPGAPGTAVPTQSVVQGFIEITNSSSSSHVWKLGIEAPSRCSAAEWPCWPDCGWSASVLLSTRGHLDGCAPTSSAVHPLSPASPWVPRSPRAGAQVDGPVDAGSRGSSRRRALDQRRSATDTVWASVKQRAAGWAGQIGDLP